MNLSGFRPTVVLTLVGVLSLAGCSGGPVDIQDLCPEMRRSICSYLDRCDYKWAMELSQHQTCQEFFSCDETEMDELQESVDQGRLAYDEDAARDCLNHFARADCSDLAIILEGADECKVIFSGLVPGGGDCYDDDECVAGYYCDESAATCPGQCQAYQQPGEPCDSQDQPCDPDWAECSWQENACVELGDVGDDCGDIWCKEGLDCDEYAEPPVCFRPGGVGAVCQENYHCQGLFYCQDGDCTGPARQGQPCRLDEYDNFAFVCEAGSYCDANLMAQQREGTCQPKKTPGQECLIYFECQSGLLCLGAELDPDTQTITQGTCGQPLKEGQECNPFQEGLPECDMSLFCDALSQTCVAYPEIGDSCVFDEHPECRGRGVYCDSLEYGVSGTCQAQKPEGESCTDSVECLSYSCASGVCQPDDPCQP